MPDADKYGDRGSNTLGHIALRKKDWSIPNLLSLGLGELISMAEPAETGASSGAVFSRVTLRGAYAKLASSAPAKDTTSGHWELAGIRIPKPFPTYPHGFPAEIISLFESKIGGGLKVLGNKTASGTEIIQELGE